MPKKKTKAEKDQALSFEESVEQLQQIVRNLEDGTLGLEESLEQYKQGTALLKNCLNTLKEAEQKIEQISGIDAEGNPIMEPFDQSATIEQREKTAGRRKQSSSSKKESSSADQNESSERNLF